MSRIRMGAAAVALALSGAAGAQSADMTFFVTSAGSGKGADFGGLDGRRPAVPDARRGGGRRGQDVACLPQHAGRGAP